ncbi:S-adenosyl-L-methionine-dependent methyltransferase [Jimgerdemannia flammicorona]|uniref:S-adenosyl-L-methionine-dependent methyltransferase n=1 Tax=Jimgerdemannia flammicorona TaxID=994334 RepID=A0A433QY71_9FUNG|nr:S-adenosyl-L-methionine-dependent methyltransferase [Jimgerdemannia flammicorona]
MGIEASKIKRRSGGRIKLQPRSWPRFSPSTRSKTSSMEVRPSNAPTTAADDVPDFRWMEGRKYHAVKGSSYFLPRDNQEIDRLIMQHYLVKSIFEGSVLSAAEQVFTRKDATILDVGCGPGTWIIDIAADHPDTECHAIDMSPIFPETLNPPNISFHKCNVLEGLPFEDESFDFVHMRSLIFGLRAGEWPAVLAELFRVTKPGGFIQLVESEVAYVTADPACYAHMEKRTSMVLTTWVWLVGGYRLYQDRSVTLCSSEISAVVVCSILSMGGQDPYVATHLAALVPSAGFQLVTHEKRSIAVVRLTFNSRYELGWNGQLSEIWFNDAKAIGQATKTVFAPALNKTLDEYDEYVDDLVNKLRDSRSYTNWHAVLGRRPLA